VAREGQLRMSNARGVEDRFCRARGQDGPARSRGRRSWQDTPRNAIFRWGGHSCRRRAGFSLTPGGATAEDRRPGRRVGPFRVGGGSLQLHVHLPAPGRRAVGVPAGRADAPADNAGRATRRPPARPVAGGPGGYGTDPRPRGGGGLGIATARRLLSLTGSVLPSLPRRAAAPARRPSHATRAALERTHRVNQRGPPGFRRLLYSD
jgi:hypothetical protein